MRMPRVINLYLDYLYISYVNNIGLGNQRPYYSVYSNVKITVLFWRFTRYRNLPLSYDLTTDFF